MSNQTRHTINLKGPTSAPTHLFKNNSSQVARHSHTFITPRTNGEAIRHFSFLQDNYDFQAHVRREIEDVVNRFDSESEQVQ
jgi:hypothetical protein